MVPQILRAASFIDDVPSGALAEHAPSLAEHQAVSAGVKRLGRVFDLVALTLLILAAGALTFRPSDLLPALHKAPIYEALIAGCLLASVPRLLTIGVSRMPLSNAMVVLFVAMVPAVAMSHLAQGNTWDARIGGGEMLKACVFALLVVAHVDTIRRLRTILLAVVTATIAMSGLALLHYHRVLDVPALALVEQANVGNGDGESAGSILRLCGIGVFNDPNDFGLLLVVGLVICAYAMFEGQGIIARTIALVPFGIFGYALYLTHSRSAFIAAVTALLAYVHVRLGFRNAIPVGVVLVAALFGVASGRQTTLNLDNPDDTFQSRLELWNHTLDTFRADPVFGVGQGKIVEMLGHVVHNSYLQAFAELGFLGGVIFCGLFASVLAGLWKARPDDSDMARMRPCVSAIVAGYAMGLLSLSRCYTVPTQLVVALGAAYLSIGATVGGAVIPRFDVRFVARLVVIALGVLFGIYAIVRLLLQAGI
jgi:O-antigen ligase